MRISIPPGYEDKEKKVDSRLYGDLVIWKEILKKAEEKPKRPIIFITNDSDWLLEIDGRSMGPRPELVKEIYDSTGTRFYIYPTDRFAYWAKEYSGLKNMDEAISEARTLRQKGTTVSWLSNKYNEMLLLPFGSVIGTVFDQNKVGIPYANITLFEFAQTIDNKPVLGNIVRMPQNPQQSNDGRTAAVGSFMFTRVPLGDYVIMAEKDGHEGFASVEIKNGVGIAKGDIIIRDYAYFLHSYMPKINMIEDINNKSNG